MPVTWCQSYADFGNRENLIGGVENGGGLRET
jgi:hypothetical protein